VCVPQGLRHANDLTPPAGVYFQCESLAVMASSNTASLSYLNDQLGFDPHFRALLWRAINYSYRKATMGATLVARRAGTKVAISATAASNRATPMKVTGSPAWTP